MTARQLIVELMKLENLDQTISVGILHRDKGMVAINETTVSIERVSHLRYTIVVEEIDLLRAQKVKRPV